jgi:hypothetical protein
MANENPTTTPPITTKPKRRFAFGVTADSVKVEWFDTFAEAEVAHAGANEKYILVYGAEYICCLHYWPPARYFVPVAFIQDNVDLIEQAGGLDLILS